MWSSFRPQARGAIIAVLFLFASTTVLASCGQPAASGGVPSRSTEAGAPLEEIVLEIPTNFCTGCQPRIEASARSVPGVKEVKFDENRIHRVAVIYDPSQTTPEAIVQAIEMRGDSVNKVIWRSEQ